MFLTSPRGIKFDQKFAYGTSILKEIVILCNRYEGVDQRAIDYYGFCEVSIGDYILLGGETAAMAIIESSCRLVDGVLGNKESIEDETFSIASDFVNIEHDHYTKPREWNDLSVPDILLSGNHREISLFRKKKSH